jgi:hypothetical protein
VAVGRSGEGDRRRWCGFNASVSAQEGRRRNEVLPKNEAEAASLSWLHGKEATHDAAMWRHRPEERQRRGGETKETMQLA